MEWILQEPLLALGLAGVVLFLLAGLIAMAVLKRRRHQIENAIQQEYEQASGTTAV